MATYNPVAELEARGVPLDQLPPLLQEVVSELTPEEVKALASIHQRVIARHPEQATADVSGYAY